MKTYIVLAHVDFYDRKHFAEEIENVEFQNISDFLVEAEKLSDSVGGHLMFFELSDFMDSCNNQEIETLDNWWVTYIHIS